MFSMSSSERSSVSSKLCSPYAFSNSMFSFEVRTDNLSIGIVRAGIGWCHKVMNATLAFPELGNSVFFV